MSWELRYGDALTELATLEPATVDCVLTDPPYIIGGSSIGNPRAKTSTWPDMVNAAVWYRTWFLECERLLTDRGHLIVFGNWRSLPTYLCAAASLERLFPASCAVWDKLWIGPASKRALRPRYEMILWLTMPDAEISDRSAPDIMAHKWHGNLAKRHPAEKPEALMVSILKTAIGDDDIEDKLILDPFCGSATVGAAALSLGMRFIGMESNEAHIQPARDRLAERELFYLCGPLLEPARSL